MKYRNTLICVFGVILLYCMPVFSLAQDYTDDLNAAMSALKTGDYKKARSLFEPLVERVAGIDREKVMGYFLTFFEVGEYAAGLEEIEEKLQNLPDDPYLLNMKGRFLVATGKDTEAEQSFLRSRQQKFDYWRNLLDLAELFNSRGRLYEAQGLYNELIYQYNLSNLKTAEEVAYAAKAMYALDRIPEANNAYQAAEKIDPENLLVLQWYAELFNDKFNPDEARANYEKAFEININKADLHTGFARAVESFGAMEELANNALELNPNSVAARTILSEILILDSRYDGAEQELEKALAVNPSSIEALAYLASIHHLRNEKEKFDEIEKRAININPNSGEFYYIIAENCVRRYRYNDAVTFGYSAIQRDPRHWKAFALVGINLLRTGQVSEAYRYLTRAFDNEPYNTYASNTLNLIDEYANFETLESEHFSLIIHNTESGVLGQDILRLAEESFDSLSARYPYRPAGKIRIEAYNDHADFAVRISGMPGVGLLGVTFGDVVAFDTPEARSDYAAQMALPDNEFNWSRTLWHELAHVMALGISDHRVPRWFTEGLSVYEEKRARPEWARDMELEFFAALDQDMLLTLEEINTGFTRPKYPRQIMLTYYQSSRLIEFIAHKYGFSAITGLLAEFGKGNDLETSFMAVLDQKPEEVEKEFFDGLRSEMQNYETVLVGLSGLFSAEHTEASFLEKLTGVQNPLFENLKSGYDLLQEQKLDEAGQKFRDAIELFPNYIEQGNAYEGLAAVYRAQEDKVELQEILERYLTITEYGAYEALELAGMFMEKGMEEKAEYYFKRSLEVRPYEITTHTNLAEMYERQNIYSEEIEHRRIILALDPLDRSKAFYYLALSLYNDGEIPEAKMAVLKSLEISPGYREAQKLLLKCRG